MFLKRPLPNPKHVTSVPEELDLWNYNYLETGNGCRHFCLIHKLHIANQYVKDRYAQRCRYHMSPSGHFYSYLDSNAGCTKVGPTSGRQYRRWSNVGPTYIAVWVIVWRQDSSFEDRLPADWIYGYPIFKWFTLTWLIDKVPGNYNQ